MPCIHIPKPREQIKSWLLVDKTGTGSYDTVNDVTIIWLINCKPAIDSIYITENKATFYCCNAAIAENQ